MQHDYSLERTIGRDGCHSVRWQKAGTLVAIHGAGATRDSVAFGQFLAEAAGVRPDPGIGDTMLTPVVFRQRVDALYTAMREALRRGDWVAFGKAYDDLGRLVRSPASPK